LAQHGVFDAATFVLDTIHEAASPDKFRGEQAQAKKNGEPPRAWRDKHDDAYEKQSESGDDAKAATNLVERGLEHNRSTNRLFEDGRSGDGRQVGANPFDLHAAWN